jgi:hypothetical protein
MSGGGGEHVGASGNGLSHGNADLKRVKVSHSLRCFPTSDCLV